MVKNIFFYSTTASSKQQNWRPADGVSAQIVTWNTETRKLIGESSRQRNYHRVNKQLKLYTERWRFVFNAQ